MEVDETVTAEGVLSGKERTGEGVSTDPESLHLVDQEFYLLIRSFIYFPMVEKTLFSKSPVFLSPSCMALTSSS